MFIVNLFPFYAVLFFSRKLCFLWSPCLVLITELFTLDTSGKPTVWFFLKITFLSWIILSILLDELNSTDWLLNGWWWIFLKKYLFYCSKIILTWQKIWQIFWGIYLNIIFWKLLWLLTSLVIWNLNITVSTALKYCHKKALNKKLKLMAVAMKYFPKKVLDMKYFGLWFSELRNSFGKTFKTLQSPLLRT